MRKELYPCAKQRVTCFILTDTEVFTGNNDCLNDIKECPRKGLPTGEGYELCSSVCNQQGHAEIQAINQAKRQRKYELLKGAEVYMFGHNYCCDSCLKELKKAGVTKITFGSAGKDPVISYLEDSE